MDFQPDPVRTDIRDYNNHWCCLLKANQLPHFPSTPPPHAHIQQEEVMERCRHNSLGLGAGGSFSKVVFLGEFRNDQSFTGRIQLDDCVAIISLRRNLYNCYQVEVIISYIGKEFILIQHQGFHWYEFLLWIQNFKNTKLQ